MPKENAIDYVEIPVVDLPRAKAFFSALFGWEFVDYGPDYCSFTDGRIDGGFFTSDRPISPDAGALRLVFYKTDLEAAARQVVELKGTITKEIFSFPGGRRFHFNDPDGSGYAIWTDQNPA